MSPPPTTNSGTEGIRDRHAWNNVQEESANAATVEDDDLDSIAQKPRKTYGRTPDGTVFVVPQTRDMVSQLLDPRRPKNISDLIVLSVLALHMLTLYALPANMRQPIFAVIFVFWRGCYNIFIGYLLHVQSNHRRLVAWAKQKQIFDKLPHNPRPWLYHLLKRDFETKIPNDYSFEEAPVDYNTWMVFRCLVDLILMCDFTSYVLFAFACSGHPVKESILVTVARWTVGLCLVGFNIWVKLDAHRIVSNFAWYWGDHFFLIDAELKFDGCFELAPHPMYSIGYAGFYGISMIAASYKVLLISLFAHALQFVFLIFVENPHIEKTYNAPEPKRSEQATLDWSGGEDQIDQSQPPAMHNLMGLKNVDLYRITDVSVIILQVYVFFLTALTPSTPVFQAFFILNALIWRLWFSVGLGFILVGQSKRKLWTRHFVKFGEETHEAWRQWKGMYHISMTMCYASLIAAAWKVYEAPTEWAHGLALCRHIFGASLIALQAWTAVSIYESLGEFGWFHGDFFYHNTTLTYSGIYRYLNNPERIIGLAGIWGAVFITGSKAIFAIALLSHVVSLGFIEFVERPHMQNLYGRSLRQEAGITKAMKRTLPMNIQGGVDRVLQGTGHLVEDFLGSARPRLGDLFKSSKTSAHTRRCPPQSAIPHSASELHTLDPSDYSIRIIESSSIATLGDLVGRSPKSDSQNFTDAFRPLLFDYGSPIALTWKAPVNHSKRDWIGVYHVTDNNSRRLTRVSAAGRWIATVPNEYEFSANDDEIISYNVPVEVTEDGTDPHSAQVSGQMIFQASKLFWETGTFEFRYHHNGKHNAMAISLPFEVCIRKCESDEIMEMEEALLPVLRNCFDRDPMIAPNTVTEAFGTTGTEGDYRYAKRVIYAIHQMFGIEFAPEVVLADGTVKHLVWRISNAKKVLVCEPLINQFDVSAPSGCPRK